MEIPSRLWWYATRMGHNTFNTVTIPFKVTIPPNGQEKGDGAPPGGGGHLWKLPRALENDPLKIQADFP